MTTRKHPDRLERHSGTGTRGQPKKGGQGKYGWGKVTEQDGVEVLDENDPNYDEDPELATQAVDDVTGVPYCSPLESIVQDLFFSGDVDEAIKTFKELDLPHENEHFVKKAMELAIEKQGFERELVSQLLSGLYSNPATPNQIVGGFQYALNSLDELSLDSPDASEILARFIARAVVDDIVPPSFLKNAPIENEKAEGCLSLARVLVNEKHGGERLLNIWGPGNLCSVKRMKEEVQDLLKEYLDSEDLAEAEKCIRRLNAPSFSFQIVKMAIRLSLEKENRIAKQVLALLNHFVSIGLITSQQFRQGWKCVFDTIGDLKLDNPNAEALFSDFTGQASSLGLVPENFKGMIGQKSAQ